MNRTFGLVLALALLLGLPVAAGAAQTTAVASAGFVFGDCDTPDSLFDLNVPAELPGQWIGSTVAVPAGQSFTLIPAQFADLIAEESSILLWDEIGDPLACGPIGGVPDEDGALAIGLAPVDGSGVVGVAYFLPDGDNTVVSVFTTDLDGIAQNTTVPDDFDTIATDASAIESDEAGSGVFSADELVYVNELIQIMDTMTTSLDTFATLFDDPQPDDSEWNFNLLLELVTWEDLQGQVNQLAPPPAFTEIHQVTVEAFGLYVSAGDDVIAGLETNDGATLQSAAAKLELANSLIRDATDLVEEMIDERSQ